MGLLWFAVTLRLAGQGLGWAVPAYLALAFVCLVLAVIDAATRLLPNTITYPAFPVAAGLLLAASLGLGELGRLGRGLLAAASVGGLFLLLAQLVAAVRTLAGRRCAAGRPGRRRGRRLVPGRLARRQVGRVSSCGR
jgi:prepilin signal peptidase PulO-like enzyme (type II secretory pathway)